MTDPRGPLILADTSAWVEFDRRTGSAVNARMRELIGNGGGLVVTEPVIAELMAGTPGGGREVRLRTLLNSFDLLPFRPASDFNVAARINQDCRRAGVTPRGMYDCLIAAVAWRTGAALLARDVDLTRIADLVGIELDQG